MDLFAAAAAKHFTKNPTPETADMILLLGEEIQKLIEVKEVKQDMENSKLRGVGRGLIQRRDGHFSPRNEFIWIGDTREQHREEHIEPSGGVCVAALDACEAEEMFRDAEEKNYENDKDTSTYLEIFCDVPLLDGAHPIPDWFGENKTYFFPWNCPKGYWHNRKHFNENDPEDVGVVRVILKVRKEFYENAPPKAYRCWRAATILADESGIGSLSELRKCGYIDADISSLYKTNFIDYSNDKVILPPGRNPDLFQLNGYFR